MDAHKTMDQSNKEISASVGSVEKSEEKGQIPLQEGGHVTFISCDSSRISLMNSKCWYPLFFLCRNNSE